MKARHGGFMKIKDRLTDGKIHVSFEVFPPKTNDSYDSVISAVDKIARLRPSFVSVTYGAGGGTRENTLKIASHIQNDIGVAGIAHLTCVATRKSDICDTLGRIRENGIDNILALRGDLPEGASSVAEGHYRYACELIKDIKEYGDFCVGAACYPEGHTESKSRDEDIAHLKEKVECGADFLTTQMFFDNAVFYKFLYRVRERGITVPVLPGIMPVTNGKQIKRICALSGSPLPERFLAIVDRYKDRPEAMTQAGVAYATDQIVDLLANGITNIHVYSMNKPEVAKAILSNISELIA